MWNNTSVSELLRIKYPIIQGPFGGRFSSVKLVSTVSNLGGMGSFGLNAYSAEEIIQIDRDIKAKTANSYALNLWLPLKDDPVNQFNQNDFNEVRDGFRPHFEKVGVEAPHEMNKATQDFEQQVEALIEARPPVASFIFGIPSKEIIKELKKQEVITIAVATSVEEAHIIEESGIDIVIASGQEAGGHRASFLNKGEYSLETTASLVQKIRKKLRIPMIAAGGITTGTDIVEIMKLGADAVQLGTAFLATEESNASKEHKEKLLANTKFETKLTNVFTGRMARVITTDFVNERHDKIAPYPIQSSFLSSLRKAAKEQGLLSYEAFWAGQPSTVLRHQSTSSLFESLLRDIERIQSENQRSVPLD